MSLLQGNRSEEIVGHEKSVEDAKVRETDVVPYTVGLHADI